MYYYHIPIRGCTYIRTRCRVLFEEKKKTKQDMVGIFIFLFFLLLLFIFIFIIFLNLNRRVATTEKKRPSETKHARTPSLSDG